MTGVPFFTIDYWGRTKFLIPTIAKGAGRGKGRQRLYSYGDLVRLRVARDLREQDVSLSSLRAILTKLAAIDREIGEAPFVVVGRAVEIARSHKELAALLARPGRPSFGVLLDLRELLETLRKNESKLPRSEATSQ